MTRPNIRTTKDHHRYECRYSGRGTIETWAWAGDVRRCPHGIVQVSYAVPGSIPAYWQDLHPVFTPIRWRRALRALAGQP